MRLKHDYKTDRSQTEGVQVLKLVKTSEILLLPLEKKKTFPSEL